MASVRARADTGQLFFDFRYKGIRCREQTSLEDNKTNRSKMEKILIKIEEDIEADRFEYRRYFPNSKNADKFDDPTTVLSKVALETQKALEANKMLVESEKMNMETKKQAIEINLNQNKKRAFKINRDEEGRVMGIAPEDVED